MRLSYCLSAASSHDKQSLCRRVIIVPMWQGTLAQKASSRPARQVLERFGFSVSVMDGSLTGSTHSLDTHRLLLIKWMSRPMLPNYCQHLTDDFPSLTLATFALWCSIGHTINHHGSGRRQLFIRGQEELQTDNWPSL